MEAGLPAAPASAEFGFGTPWAEQLAFFRRKLNLPTEWWDDILRSANDRAFIVAGAAKADLLQDLRSAMDGAMAGGGLAGFRKSFKAVVASHGWTGWAGEGSTKGEAWRTRIIYQTNMATSYAAGQYRQMTAPDFVVVLPYWRYRHADGQLHPRPLHQAWDGLTLPHDHPFWKTHFAPNGWGCRCKIFAVPAPAAGAPTAPPEGWDKIDPATGAPVGIDRGFDYAPGANAATPLRQMVQDKLITYPPAVAKALSADVNRHLVVGAGGADAAQFVRAALASADSTSPLWLGFVEDAPALTPLAQVDVAGYFVTVPPSTVRHVANSHGFDGRGQRPARPEDFALVAQVLNQADTLRAGDNLSSGHATVVAIKQMGGETSGETWRAVFEVLPGKRNRALALLSLIIKTA